MASSTGNSEGVPAPPSSRSGAPSTSAVAAVGSLLSGDAAAEAEAVKALRTMMATADNVDFLPRPGLTKLVQIVGEEVKAPECRRKTQLDAAWILTKVSASSSEMTAMIVTEGGVQHFVKHLADDAFEDMRVQSVWVLGNIAGDSPARRDFVIQQGILAPLLHLISQNTRFKRQENTTHVLALHPVRLSVWCLSNLCRVSPGPPPNFASLLPSLPVLARMLQVQDREILRDACSAFASLADGSHEKIQSVINSGVVPRLVELLRHTSKMVVASALRAVGNILLGDDTQTQFVIDHRGLSALLLLLLHDNEHLRRDACRATSNITAGNADQIQAVLDEGLFPILIALMQTPTSVGVDVEAGWALLNVARRGRPDQLEALQEMGCDTRIFTLGLPLPLPRPGQGAGAGNVGGGGIFPMHRASEVHSLLQQAPPLHHSTPRSSHHPSPPPAAAYAASSTAATAAAINAAAAAAAAAPASSSGVILTTQRRRLSVSTLGASTASSSEAASDVVASNVASTASIPMLNDASFSLPDSEIESEITLGVGDEEGSAEGGGNDGGANDAAGAEDEEAGADGANQLD